MHPDDLKLLNDDPVFKNMMLQWMVNYGQRLRCRTIILEAGLESLLSWEAIGPLEFYKDRSAADWARLRSDWIQYLGKESAYEDMMKNYLYNMQLKGELRLNPVLNMIDAISFSEDVKKKSTYLIKCWNARTIFLWEP